MHATALANARHFFDCYAPALASQARVRVVEVGAQDVNGSIRACCPPAFEYVGVDVQAGKGVDLVLADPYTLPFDDGTVDIVVSSSCFEHSEFFWLLFLEIMRVLEPHGLFYLNAPSNGGFHRHPVDCWRFYPDSGRALARWARRNGMPVRLLESYTSLQVGDQWNDFVAVFVRHGVHAERYPHRILDAKHDFTNGLSDRAPGFLRHNPLPEDKAKMQAITQIIANQIKLI